MSEIKLSTILVSFGGSEGEYILHLTLSSCLLTAMVGVLWLVDASVRSLCLLPHGTFPLCQYLFFFFSFYKYTSRSNTGLSLI